VLQAAEAALVAHLERVSSLWAKAYLTPGWKHRNDQLLVSHPHKAHDVSWRRRQVLTETAREAGVGRDQADEAFEVFLTARQRVTLYPEAASVLTWASQQYRLVALTNGNACVHRTGVGHWFEMAVSPMSVHTAKPDPEFFHHMMRQMRVSPQQVIHIGDDPHTDVLGALGVGIRPIWINRYGRPWPSATPWGGEAGELLQVADLNGLRELLSRL